MFLLVVLGLLLLVCCMLCDDIGDAIGFAFFWGVGITLLFWACGYWEHPKQHGAPSVVVSQSQQNPKPDENSAYTIDGGNNTTDAVATNTTTESNTTADDKNVVSSKVGKDQLYGKFPRTYPDDSDGRTKWWHDWAVFNTDGDPIICRDGIQVVVGGQGNTDNGGATAIYSRNRLHPDGKPYTCSESTDPTKELSS